MGRSLWSRNFCLVTLATVLGAAGSIAGGFALSFFVFDETGSTLASALVLAVQMVPHVLLPLAVAPWMDRLSRKAFLVGGDAANGVVYGAMGLWLLFCPFSYVGYLGISLVLACLGAVDELAYTSIYPDLIPEGLEERGYAVSSMLYPVLRVVLMPLSAVLLEGLGVAGILLLQSGLSLGAAALEGQIRLERRVLGDEGAAVGAQGAEAAGASGRYSFREWWGDIREAWGYLRGEPGLRAIYGYMAVTNGVADGYAPILVAFFRTMPGMTAAMYSFFSVAEFLGRSLGSAFQYRVGIRAGRRFSFAFFVYQVYEVMDMCLLWLPYPWMLVNRGVCGFLGSNSAILRSAAVQRYIPQRLRSRLNAFEGVWMTAAAGVFSLAVGALGECLDYRVCVTVCGGVAFTACWAIVGRRRAAVRCVYEADAE